MEKSYQKANISAENEKLILNSANSKQLRNLLSNNPIAVRAAIAAGISKRNNRGVLTTKSNVTMQDIDKMREALYGELELRGVGLGGNRSDFYDPKNENAIVKR